MRRLLTILLIPLLLAACPAAPPAPRTPAGFQASLRYEVDVDRALHRQLLSLAATLHQMLSHPVRVATVEVVDRGIWVTPRNEEVRAELRPALVEAVGDAFLVRQTSGMNLMVKRTRTGRERTVSALVQATAAAVRERLANIAPASKVTVTGRKQMAVHIKKGSAARAVRQVLGQRGALSLHLVDRGDWSKSARLPFQLMKQSGRVLQRQPCLSGELVQRVRLERSGGGATVMTLEFTGKGAARLTEAAQSYGDIPLAVLLDGQVLAAPALKDPPDDEGKTLVVPLDRSMIEAKVESLSQVLESAVLNGPLPARLVER